MVAMQSSGKRARQQSSEHKTAKNMMANGTICVNCECSASLYLLRWMLLFAIVSRAQIAAAAVVVVVVAATIR